jgi:hypothetical protein
MGARPRKGGPVTEPSAEQKNGTWIIRAGLGAGAALKSRLAAVMRWLAALKGWLKGRSWKARAGIGAAAALVIVGIGVALVALLGRPAVSVSSGEALVQVRLGGLGTGVTAVRATSAGRPVALADRSAGFMPVAAVPQGRTVQVRVTAAPPSWLRWLLGSGVSASATLRAPAAAPSVPVAVAAHPGRVTLGFDHPVSVIDYRAGRGPARVIRLARP